MISNGPSGGSKGQSNGAHEWRGSAVVAPADADGFSDNINVSVDPAVKLTPKWVESRGVEELERSCAKGAVGVMVLANVSGKSLTDPMFAPIWAEIDRRKLPVLVHPTDPPGVDLMDMTKFDLSWSVGFMFDTTLAITRMIFEGFFDQYPDLKIIASHGGGTLPYLVGRFEKGDEVELPSRRQMKRKPTDYLRHIYYDSITYDPRSLQYLISIVGPEHVMLGTDWPHWVHDTKGAFANTARLPREQMTAVRGDNAMRVFGF